MARSKPGRGPRSVNFGSGGNTSSGKKGKSISIGGVQNFSSGGGT